MEYVLPLFKYAYDSVEDDKEKNYYLSIWNSFVNDKGDYRSFDGETGNSYHYNQLVNEWLPSIDDEQLDDDKWSKKVGFENKTKLNFMQREKFVDRMIQDGLINHEKIVVNERGHEKEDF